MRKKTIFYFLLADDCLLIGQADPSVKAAFENLENIIIANNENAVDAAKDGYVRADIVQAVNVPSLVSLAVIANETDPADGNWTRDISYAMPQYVEKGSPSSLNINWMFANDYCVHDDDYTGMNYGSVDVTYSSTKECYPLPVQIPYGK